MVNQSLLLRPVYCRIQVCRVNSGRRELLQIRVGSRGVAESRQTQDEEVERRERLAIPSVNLPPHQGGVD